MFTLSVCQNRIVVGTSNRHVLIYDVRNLSAPEQQRESSLKFQTRCIRCFPNGKGYALSSIEGRVAMEYFDMSAAAQAKKYAFKCHRAVDDKGIDTVYPVNALAFHPTHGTFATGGCDGKVQTCPSCSRSRSRMNRKPSLACDAKPSLNVFGFLPRSIFSSDCSSE